MQLKTILNRVEHYKSFVYGEDRLVQDAAGRLTLEVTIQPRSNGRPICSGCQRVRSISLPARASRLSMWRT